MAHAITMIREVQANQGWTDETLLSLALDFITARDDWSNVFVDHLEAIADEENGKADDE